MSSKIGIIKELLNSFCHEVVNSQEYARLCIKIVNQLEQHPEHPLNRGKEKIWAASIAHAVGTINLLFIQSSQPHLTVAKLNWFFDTNPITTGNKSITIRNLLSISPSNPEYQFKTNNFVDPLDEIKELIIEKFGVTRADVEAIIKQAGHPDSPIIPKTDYSALTIIPKQKFWDWVATQTNIEDISPNMRQDYNVYLVPDIELESSLEKELQQEFEEIWKIELTRYINSNMEFPKVNLSEFLEWFEVRSSSHVMDLTGELLDDFNDDSCLDDDLNPNDVNYPPDFNLN